MILRIFFRLFFIFIYLTILIAYLALVIVFGSALTALVIVPTILIYSVGIIKVRCCRRVNWKPNKILIPIKLFLLIKSA